MGYPTRLLNEGESLVYDLHPHWKALVGPALLAPVVVGVGAFLAARAPEGDARQPLRWAVLVVAVVLLVWRCVIPWLRWFTTHFVVTDRRVIMRSGVLARSGRDVPLYRINDVTFEHSFLERILGAGSLVVESGGERGQVTLTDIPHPEDVQRELYRLMEAEEERRRGGGPDPEPDDPAAPSRFVPDAG